MQMVEYPIDVLSNGAHPVYLSAHVVRGRSAALMDKHKNAILKTVDDNHAKRSPTEHLCKITEQNLQLPFDDPF